MSFTIEIKENVFDLMYEPLAGYSLKNLSRLVLQNRFRIDVRYMPRMIYATAISTIMTPFRIKESIKFNKKIQQTKITKTPLFIIGHWRSGTTYLHNMLTLDKNFGYCTTFQTTAPGIFLGSEKIVKPLVIASIPDKRPMDNADLGADLPQEEEYGLGALLPYAYYNGWCFPKNMKYYNKFVCMDDVPQATIEEWIDTYLYFLKKVTIYRNGTRLAMKNPANTARIKILLEMFPDAQFVNIYRNPYSVYFSMLKFMRIVIARYCVQKPPKMEEIEEHMMDLYVGLHKKYLKERKLIPNGNLAETKYEDFIQNPIFELKKIYATLNLDGFNKSEKVLKKYVESQKNFKASNYNMDDTVKEKIYKKWKFTFKEFGYGK